MKFKNLAITILIILSFLILSGFLYLNQKKEISNYKFTSFLLGQDLCTISESNLKNERIIWTGGSEGVFACFDNGDIKSVGEFTDVKGLYFDQDTMWVAHQNGLTAINVISDSFGEGVRSGNLKFTEIVGLPDKRVNCVTGDGTGVMWAGTWKGLVKIQNNIVERIYTSTDGLVDDMVNEIAIIGEDIWIGSYVAPRGGLTIINKSEIIQTISGESLSHPNICDIISLNDGIVLIGGGLYDRGGGTAVLVSDREFKVSNLISREKDGLAGVKIRSLLKTKDERLLIGSEYDGLVIFDSFTSDKSRELKLNMPSYYSTADGLADNEIKCIFEDSENKIWFATKSGLSKMKNKEG